MNHYLLDSPRRDPCHPSTHSARRHPPSLTRVRLARAEQVQDAEAVAQDVYLAALDGRLDLGAATDVALTQLLRRIVVPGCDAPRQRRREARHV